MKKRIFLVDDEADFCFFLAKNLEARGDLQVEVFTDARGLLDRMNASVPDLVVLDVMMPGMDGGDIASRLNQDARTKDIPVIFLTSIVKEEEASQSKGLIGGWRYVSKPVKIEALLALIDRMILLKGT
ncbi:MAG: response regulator [Candidatus Omnitrophica bacterium]|nr:response regulator [Candidatus Omnitrophota bacterium]